MTDLDYTVSTRTLAWQLGIRRTRLLETLYLLVPQEGWPGKGKAWALNPTQVEKVMDYYTVIPENHRVRFLMRDEDGMYDLAQELESSGRAVLDPEEDVATILRELIYDHGFPVTLVSRDSRQTILALDSL